MNQQVSLAIGAALRAGAEILKVYESEIAVELKDDRSPLTEADRRAHKVIHEALVSTEIPLLSEEGKTIPYAERSEWETFWMVDPLDGTKEFIKRNGEFTVNIALIRNGLPVLGVIYVPVKNTLYFGSEAGGSFKLEGVAPPAGNPQQTGVSKAPVPEGLLSKALKLPQLNGRETYTIVASRSHLSSETETIIEEKRSQHGEVNIASMGSSLKICLVAEGAADIYPRLAPTMEWDTAAGHAIAKFAGCKVYNHETGAELCYNKENLLNPWFVVER